MSPLQNGLGSMFWKGPAVYDLLLRQHLLNHEAKEECVAELPEVVEELHAGIQVLHNVLQGGLVVSEHAREALVRSLHCLGMASISILV